jgi:hypothetical protein
MFNNSIGGLIVSMLAASVVDRVPVGSNHRITLVFVAFALNTKH